MTKPTAPIGAKQSGFTLLELSIVILIFGLITGAVFSYLSVKVDQDNYQLTVDRQKKIAIALSDFVHVYGKLPCPGVTTALLLGQAQTTCALEAQRKGIVPFRALGLSQDDVTDGYGRPFTYSVSGPAAIPATTTNLMAHNYCRRNMIWSDGVSYSRSKAIFCGQRALNADTIIVNDASATPVILTQPLAAGLPIDNVWTDPNTVSTADPVLPIRLTYFAYILISHGKNGAGAYIFNSAALRSFASISGDELQNVQNTHIYVDRPYGTSFDDIILWRTQEQVIAETGNDSCSRP